MKAIEFGKINKVNLRDIWLKEEHHFTPWLCENLDKLGEVIGIDLELKQREASVGNFELDILAHDISRDRVVVIENQIEPTDHKHLGQLITYASYFKAGVIIWISESIQEQHRAAIDWLNNNTNDEIEFFAVEIEVFKIEDSKPALNFKLKAFPNEWQKTPNKEKSGVSDKMEAYRHFFQKLIDELREKHRFTNARAGQPQSWYSFSSGTTGIIYGISFAKGNKVRAELYIDTGNAESNKFIFEQLKDAEVQFSEEFQEQIEWELMENKRASRIAIYRKGSIDSDNMALDEILNWSIEKMLKFKSIFGDKIKSINKITTNK
jgi:hypothetical protein